MTLELDVNQRLNLVHILDALECTGRRETYAICKLQEWIDLSDDEKRSIDYKRERAPDGREYAMWGANGHIKPTRYDFSEEDSRRILAALDNHRVILARDRSWWEPLVSQIPEDNHVPR